MNRVLVAVDGSPNSLRAVRYLVRSRGRAAPMEVHLVNVQEPIDSPEIRRFKLPRDILRMQRRRGAKQLRAARALLDRSRVPYEAHALIGRVAETIVRLNAEGMTVLFTEQAIHQSLTTAHRGYILESGRLVLSGTSAALLANELLQRVYMGLDLEAP